MAQWAEWAKGWKGKGGFGTGGWDRASDPGPYGLAQNRGKGVGFDGGDDGGDPESQHPRTLYHAVPYTDEDECSNPVCEEIRKDLCRAREQHEGDHLAHVNEVMDLKLQRDADRMNYKALLDAKEQEHVRERDRLRNELSAEKAGRIQDRMVYREYHRMLLVLID